MIGVIASVVGGYIMGVKTTLLSPAVYISSKIRRELFLITFSAYCILLGYELELGSVYSFKALTVVFAVILPTILLLEDGLRGKKVDLKIFPLIMSLVTGIFVKEIYFIGIILTFIYVFYDDASGRQTPLVMGAILAVIVIGLILAKGALDFIGSSSSQVVFTSSLLILTIILISILFNIYNK